MPLALGFASSLVGFFVFAYMYATGYEGGNRVQEGVRFGVLVGLLLVCYGIVWEFVVLRETASRAVWMAVATLVEFVLGGFVVGAIYRPATPSACAAALV
jgi:hypothetical protein